MRRQTPISYEMLEDKINEFNRLLKQLKQEAIDLHQHYQPHPNLKKLRDLENIYLNALDSRMNFDKRVAPGSSKRTHAKTKELNVHISDLLKPDLSNFIKTNELSKTMKMSDKQLKIMSSLMVKAQKIADPGYQSYRLYENYKLHLVSLDNEISHLSAQLRSGEKKDEVVRIMTIYNSNNSFAKRNELFEMLNTGLTLTDIYDVNQENVKDKKMLLDLADQATFLLNNFKDNENNYSLKTIEIDSHSDSSLEEQESLSDKENNILENKSDNDNKVIHDDSLTNEQKPKKLLSTRDENSNSDLRSSMKKYRFF